MKSNLTVFLLLALGFGLYSCSSRKFNLISIGLVKEPVEGGTPLVLCFDNLEGINLDFDELPTDNYYADFIITDYKGKVYKEQDMLAGWQKGNCLMINAALLDQKGTPYEESMFYSEGIVFDSIRSIEISVYTDDSSPELVCHKVIKKFDLLPENTDFYTFK